MSRLTWRAETSKRSATSPVLRRRIAIKAAAKKESMNQYLEELIEKDTKDVEAAIG